MQQQQKEEEEEILVVKWVFLFGVRKMLKDHLFTLLTFPELIILKEQVKQGQGHIYTHTHKWSSKYDDRKLEVFSRVRCVCVCVCDQGLNQQQQHQLRRQKDEMV